MVYPPFDDENGKKKHQWKNSIGSEQQQEQRPALQTIGRSVQLMGCSYDRDCHCDLDIFFFVDIIIIIIICSLMDVTDRLEGTEWCCVR
jgi:hypothetical protein